MDPAELAAAWRDVINGPDKSWVVFENGTCVVLTDPADDLPGRRSRSCASTARSTRGRRTGTSERSRWTTAAAGW